MDIPGIRCLTCIHTKVCSLKPTLLMYEMMAKEMGKSRRRQNPISSKSSNHRRACYGKEQTQSRTLPMRSQTLR